MKLTIQVLLALSLSSCQHNENQEISKVDHRAKLQALAKKYDIKLTITPNPTGRDANGKALPPISLEQVEKEFQAVAASKVEKAENNRQVEAMSKEIGGVKNLMPSDYFALLEKYPLVKRANISQYGGPEAFEKYKQAAIAKEKVARRLYEKHQNQEK